MWDCVDVNELTPGQRSDGRAKAEATEACFVYRLGWQSPSGNRSRDRGACQCRVPTINRDRDRGACEEQSAGSEEHEVALGRSRLKNKSRRMEWLQRVVCFFYSNYFNYFSLFSHVSFNSNS